MKQIRIFIVDNQVLYRNSLIHLFKHYKDILVVGHASTSSEFLLTATDIKPDVALMSVKLDTIDAISTLQLSKNLFPAMLLIAITFQNDGEIYNKLFLAGFSGIINKDATPSKFIRIIRNVYVKYNLSNNK